VGFSRGKNRKCNPISDVRKFSALHGQVATERTDDILLHIRLLFLIGSQEEEDSGQGPVQEHQARVPETDLRRTGTTRG
jgi:hypothetical protein